MAGAGLRPGRAEHDDHDVGGDDEEEVSHVETDETSHISVGDVSRQPSEHLEGDDVSDAADDDERESDVDDDPGELPVHLPADQAVPGDGSSDGL